MVAKFGEGEIEIVMIEGWLNMLRNIFGVKKKKKKQNTIRKQVSVFVLNSLLLRKSAVFTDLSTVIHQCFSMI